MMMHLMLLMVDVYVDTYVVFNANNTCGLTGNDTETWHLHQYINCCQDDLCNDYDADLDICVYSPELEAYYMEQAKLEQINQDEITNFNNSCKFIHDVGEWYYGLLCSQISLIYPILSTDIQRILALQIKGIVNGFDQWMIFFVILIQETFIYYHH